jgi:3'-5' exoribonuclease
MDVTHLSRIAMARRIFIRDMTPNQLIDGVFTLQNCQLGQTKGGKPYLKCLLVDRTGRSPGRMWNCSEELFSTLPTDGFVFIEGQTQPYQGEMQIIIQNIRVVRPSPDDLLDLLPSTDRDVPQMFAEVRSLLDSITSPQIRALAHQYLSDDSLMARFQQAPAAMALHHAYLGGLLEHTLNLMKLAQATLPLYPQLNRDIVLFGLFLHDLGKTQELVWEAGFNYSDDGQLIGHIARGILWLEEKARAAQAAGSIIQPQLLRVLHHIILSHHGTPEFGALKIPATPEAIFIHQLDNVDAKVHMALAACRETPRGGDELGGNFTEKVWALGTRLYRANPLSADAPSSAPSPAAQAPIRPSPAPASSPASPTSPAAPQAPKPAPTLNLGGATIQPRKAPPNPNLKGGI